MLALAISLLRVSDLLEEIELKEFFQSYFTLCMDNLVT